MLQKQLTDNSLYSNSSSFPRHTDTDEGTDTKLVRGPTKTFVSVSQIAKEMFNLAYNALKKIPNSSILFNQSCLIFTWSLNMKKT